MKLGNSAFSLAYLCVSIAVLAFGFVAPGRTPRTSDPAPRAVSPLATTWPDYAVPGPAVPPPSGPDAETIRYGYQLMAQTFAVIGPEVADKAMRFAGNNLACQNCHLDGGTNRVGLSLVGVFSTFPKYSSRDHRTISLVERINECMTRSMNGRALPETSREMSAFVAYIRYLGNGPVAAPPTLPAPPLPADTTRGAEVYLRVCAACHQPDGSGHRAAPAADARGYVQPPLWGPDSYNDGAGMDRPERTAPFVRFNMPRGVDPQHPQLTVQEAWDVAAYVDSQPRPGK